MEEAVYTWHNPLGDQLYVINESTGEACNLGILKKGDLIKFPDLPESRQIQVVSSVEPDGYGGGVRTVSRAEDGIGIVLTYWHKFNYEGDPYHTISGPDDALDEFLFKGKGYAIANGLLKKHNL